MKPTVAGWACACHGEPRRVPNDSGGTQVVSPADWCPRRRAVYPEQDVPSVRDAGVIRARRPLMTGSVPAGTTLPADIHRLIPRLWKLRVAPLLTYSAHWWSVAVPDESEVNGRKTHDVPILRESVALRAWPIGVVLWLRPVLPETSWKPDVAYITQPPGVEAKLRWVRNDGTAIIPANVTMFKREVTRLEKTSWRNS